MNPVLFPIENPFSKKYLQDNFWKCFYNSNDPKYHYWIILPKNVKPISIDLIDIKELNLYMIGQYARIDDSPYLEINVGVEHVETEINCSDWLKRKLVMMNEEILKEKEFRGKSTGTYLDVLTKKKMDSGETIISRYTTMKDSDPMAGGANYFLVKASTYEDHYNDLADAMFHIVTNWDILNKTSWQLGEGLKPFVYEFNEKVSLYLPSSWEILVDRESNNTVGKFLFRHNKDDKSTGVINSFFYSDNSLNKEEVFKRSFKRLTDLERFEYELDDIKIAKNENPYITKLWHTQGLIDYKKDNFKAYLMIYIINTEKGWYYFESVGSRPNMENYNWESNKRCLEMIVDSFNNPEFEKRGTDKTIDKGGGNENKKYFKSFQGKNYTEEEWKAFEREQWEIYMKKNNMKVEEKKNKGGRFFLDEK